MKLNDELLGISRARRVQDLTAATDRERAKAKDIMMAEAQLLQSLAQHPGWELFVKECQEEERMVLGLLEQSDTDARTNKLVGTLLAVKSFQTFAQDRASEILSTIKDMDH